MKKENVVLLVGGAVLALGGIWFYKSVVGPRSPEELSSLGQGTYSTKRVQDMLKTFATLAAEYPEVEQSYRLLDPGPVDGKWKKQTWDAVKRFQGIRSIPRTGEVDLATSKEFDAVVPRYNAAKAQLAPSTKFDPNA